MTPPDPKDDDLVRLYRQASALDPQRPAPRVDAAIRAHARMVASAGQGVLSDAGSHSSAVAPANNAHGWRAMLASVAVIGLMGLLFLQFDRGTPQEKDLVQGTQQPAESGAGRLASRPESGQSEAPPTNDVAAAADSAAAADTRVANSAPTPTPTPTPTPMPAPAPGPAQVAKSSVPLMTGEGSSVLGESVTPGAPVNRTATPVPEAPMAIAREREESSKAGAALADMPQETRSKSMGPSPSARREAQAPSALSPSAPVGDAALFALARSGQVARLDAILASGVAVDTRDTRGRTPLMEAAMRGHSDLVRRLLDGGAKRQLRDFDGQTAAQLARAAGHLQLADLIDAGS